jgi:hypothetical protein
MNEPRIVGKLNRMGFSMRGALLHSGSSTPGTSPFGRKRPHPAAVAAPWASQKIDRDAKKYLAMTPGTNILNQDAGNFNISGAVNEREKGMHDHIFKASGFRRIESKGARLAQGHRGERRQEGAFERVNFDSRID